MHISTASQEDIPNGTERDINGKPSVYYDGYWIRRYDIRNDTLADKKSLIDKLTKRVFHHTEPGINTPACKLLDARRAYNSQNDPARKRVNAAMLAGALLHRAADIFTKLVELEQAGITIEPQNDLVRECGRCYLEASTLAKQVRHFSGEEGLDELWGEPFQAFALPIEQFYQERYIKLAQTMTAIDSIAQRIVETFAGFRGFEQLPERVYAFAEAAKQECEVSKSDSVIFTIWPEYVACGDALTEFQPEIPANLAENQHRLVEASINLIRRGKQIISYVASSRVPMPKTTSEYVLALNAHIEVLRNLYPRS